MATARDLIYDAMFACGALGQGDVAPSAGDADLCLRRLQRMLDSWSVDGLMVPFITEETISLVQGQQAYTTADLSTAARPVAIESGAFVRFGNVDYPLTVIPKSEWDRIGYKDTQGIPEVVWYEPDMTGSFQFYPVPAEAMTAYFNVRRVLTGPLTLTTQIDLPPGYDKAIVDCLAMDIAPSFGQQISQGLLMAARAAKAQLERMNYVPLVADTGMRRFYRYDVHRGPF